VKADPETEAAVLDVLDRFTDYYYQRDFENLWRLFAQDPDIVLIGTGEHEIVVGPIDTGAAYRRDFSQISSISAERKWVGPVSTAGDVAWVASEWLVDWGIGGTESHGLVRRTFVLERRGDKWLIVHSHASFPSADQAKGQSWPTPMESLAFAVGIERPDLRGQAAPDGTVTMLFTDIEDSTVMTERLGDARWLSVLRTHNSIVREQAEAHGCFEVKSQGDGFMIASQSARRGVHCGISIQRQFARYNETAEEQLRVRMGLHTGEVLKDADDFFGKHVILASRIANQARGGEILVSSLLKELTESMGDIPFGPPRDVELKGLAGGYRVHEVFWRES
jgi:class 3 adenylate cyclase/ketosteroid isomerase-like protein